MRIAICDDIPEFAYELKHRIEDICAKRDWPLESKLYTSAPAMLRSDLTHVQAVFLDIDMPEVNGLEAAKELRNQYPDMVFVFVTAFIEYAPAGYHVSAFRYLLKQQLDSNLPSVIEDVQQKLFESTESITIEQKSGTFFLPLKSILYLEGTPNRRVLFHLSSRETPVEALGKLADYERRLEGKGFLRLQKSFIANMAHISKISNYQVVMRNGTVLKASEKYYKQVQTSFLQWKGQHL